MFNELLFRLKRAARALAGRPPLEAFFGPEAGGMAEIAADVTADYAAHMLCGVPVREWQSDDDVRAVVRRAALDGLRVLAEWAEDERRLRREQPRPFFERLRALLLFRPWPHYTYHIVFRRASGELTHRYVDAVSGRAALAEGERRIREGDVIGIYEDDQIPDIRGEPGDVVQAVWLWGRSRTPQG